MQRLISRHRLLGRMAILYVMAVFVLCSFPLQSFADNTPSVDIKVNGSDGPITLNSGDTYTYTWTSQNATSCQLTSPLNSGIPTSGTSTTIGSGSPFYPAAGGSVTLTIECTDGVSTASDSVTLSLASSSGSVTPSSTPVATTTPSVDLKVNGSDGPVNLNSGDTYTYTWTSQNATSCQLTSPLNSGIPTSGTSTAIATGNPLYPGNGSSLTLTVECTDGTNTASDSVIINGSSNTGGGNSTSTLPTVDIKANGSDGPLTLTHGDTYTYTWTSQNATSCQLTSPLNSGIPTSGTSTAIGVGSPFYPADNSSVTLTVECTDSVHTASDSVVINVVPIGGGGGSCPVPAINSSLSASGDVGTAFNYSFDFGSSTVTSFSLTASSLPDGLTFSTTTNSITGTPTKAGTFTISLNATNSCGSTTPNLTITINQPGGGGGGGGGGSTSSGGGGVVLSGFGGGGQPIVLGSGGGRACQLLHDYMRIDFQNDPTQVTLLQAFLKTFGGYDYVTVNGVFDQATFNAVSAFQQKYASDILTPWGLTAPTGYVYILTLKKINEIYCQTVLSLTPAQQQEINSYRSLIQNQGLSPSLPVVGEVGGSEQYAVSKEGAPEARGVISGTPIVLGPGATNASSTAALSTQRQTLSSIAASIFSLPKTPLNLFQCLWELLLILVVLYILGSVLEDVLYSDLPENARKKFFAKWTTIVVGLVVSIVAAIVLKEWCLVLPLAIVLLAALVWMTLSSPKGFTKVTPVLPMIIPPTPAETPKMAKTTTTTTTSTTPIPSPVSASQPPKETKKETKVETTTVQSQLEPQQF